MNFLSIVKIIEMDEKIDVQGADSTLKPLQLNAKPNLRAPSRQRLTKAQKMYAKSRMKYLPRLSLTGCHFAISLDVSNIKTGVANRGSQTKRDAYAESTQTEIISHDAKSTQIPEFAKENRFPSVIHFLKAATSTISALIEKNSELGAATIPDSERLSKVADVKLEHSPQRAIVDSGRIIVMVREAESLGKIQIFSIRERSLLYGLISSASPSCFDAKGKYVIAGTSTGSILLWNLDRIEKVKSVGTALLIQPEFSTDLMGLKNHRFPIASIQLLERKVICAVDSNSGVSFWYLKSDGLRASLVKAESLSVSRFPATSIAMLPESTNQFLVSSGLDIVNCNRFGGQSAPAKYKFGYAAHEIAFSRMDGTFAVGGDNGKLALFELEDGDPVLSCTVTNQFSKISLAWSPCRNSVLFAGDQSGMRVLVYDFSVSRRAPVYSIKVTSSVNSIGAFEVSGSVFLAVCESGNCISIYRVADELSRPLPEGAFLFLRS